MQIEGTQIIKSYCKSLPNRPGVYRMMDEKGAVLYVGKAKALKKRVINYTQIERHTNRIQRMISLTRSMEFIETKSEAEALLLESNLIKKLKPAFNVVLRDDKMFPFIMVTGDHEYPLLTKHRGAQKKPHRYFGPFANATAVNNTLISLQKAFMLRSCSDSEFENRKRPCLQYQIKRCTAPCVGYVSREEYRQQKDEVIAFLRGKSQTVQRSLQKQMEQASEAMEFEKAAALRDRIRALTTIQAEQNINTTAFQDADVIALYHDRGRSCIQVFFFRGGRAYGNRAFFPSHEKEMEAEEILHGFIMQFYQNKAVPPDILISHPVLEHALIEEALSHKEARKIRLSFPQKGERRKILDLVLMNAQESLKRKDAEQASQEKLLDSLVDVFSLDKSPERIEVYDNSHISGSQAVGVMIVAGREGFIKNHYRKFTIKQTQNSPDDYAMMAEVFRRRFARALKEDTPLPDLILVDGGKGQLSSALAVLEELGLGHLKIFGISKGPDRNAGLEKFHDSGGRVFELERTHPTLYFIQRLRDESHRFAIGTHRAKRVKEISTSPLDGVPSIGPRRKKALLMHFGSAKAVTQARVEDLMKAEGISQTTAQIIYDFFHQ